MRLLENLQTNFNKLFRKGRRSTHTLYCHVNRGVPAILENGRFPLFQSEFIDRMNVSFARQNRYQEDPGTICGLKANDPGIDMGKVVFRLHQYGCRKQEEKVVTSGSIHSDYLQVESVPADNNLVTL